MANTNEELNELDENGLLEISPEMHNRFVFNMLADHVLYTEGVDTDVNLLFHAMEAMGVEITLDIVDMDKFGAGLNNVLELGYAARDAAIERGEL